MDNNNNLSSDNKKLILEIKSLKKTVDEYEKENKDLKNEIKRLQNENKSLKQKIYELNLIIEELKSQISELESNKERPKNRNELFCELYEKFSKKKLMKYKIDMIIGMHLQRLMKECEKKCSKYKRRIAELTEELHMLKYGKKMPSNLEELQDKIADVSQVEGDGENYLKNLISKRSNSQGIGRFVDIGTTTQPFGNAIITTRTTQISYKRKRHSKKQKSESKK